MGHNSVHPAPKAPAARAATKEALAGVMPLPMGNIEIGWDEAGERLVIIIGCSAERRAAAAPSSSGKSRLLASTQGFIPVPTPDQIGLTGLKLHVNATLPNDEYFEGARRSGYADLVKLREKQEAERSAERARKNAGKIRTRATK